MVLTTGYGFWESQLCGVPTKHTADGRAVYFVATWAWGWRVGMGMN